MFIELNSKKYYAYTASHDADAERDTVIFVHGTAMDHTVWALQSRYFAYHNYNILAVNLPGHGQSQGEPLDTIEGYANWLTEIMSKSNAKRFHLVGHSMGSLICLEAAAQYGSKNPSIASLSLVGFSYPMAVTPVLLDAAQNRPSEAYEMMTQWSHTSSIGGEPNPGFWSSGGQMSMMENSRPGAVYTDLVACNAYDNGPQAFEQIATPILFISGVLDKMAPSKLAKAQADSNPNASIVMLPRCGHSIMSENPDGVRDALKDFIAVS
ncbi:MAG: alpha/beta hydrolase [Acidiferrobacterales bacterium]|nr:alpha/beta hydrolase [Acidiferrobacterales bacterium]